MGTIREGICLVFCRKRQDSGIGVFGGDNAGLAGIMGVELFTLIPKHQELYQRFLLSNSQTFFKLQNV